MKPLTVSIHTTNQAAYSKAALLIKHATFVIFIGYSFGFFRQSQSFDDIETFEFFRDRLKHCPKEVLVLSPNPEFVVNTIKEATSRVRVHPLPFNWNHLCQAITEVCYKYRCKQFIKLKPLINWILYRHDQLKDGEP